MPVFYLYTYAVAGNNSLARYKETVRTTHSIYTSRVRCVCGVVSLEMRLISTLSDTLHNDMK